MSSRAGTVLLATVLLGVACSPGALAQDAWSADAAAGLSVPVGDLADYYDLGWSVGATLSYRVHSRVRAQLIAVHHSLPGADWDNVEPVEWTGEKPQGPEARFSYFLVGASVPLTFSEREGWQIRASAGGGVARVDLEQTRESLGGMFVRPAAGGEVEMAYPVSEAVRLFGRSGGFLFLRTLDGGVIGRGFGLGKELTFSYTAGLRFTF